MDAWSIDLPLPLEIIIDICSEHSELTNVLLISELGRDPKFIKLLMDSYKEKHPIYGPKQLMIDFLTFYKNKTKNEESIGSINKCIDDVETSDTNCVIS